MNNAIKTIIITGAVGATAGIGYALLASRKQERTTGDQTADDVPDDLVIEQPRGPDVPLREPPRPRKHIVINHSEHDDDGTVLQSPTELLAQARAFDPQVTLDELTGARLAASEHARGSFTELACIVDSELNRARRRGKSLFDSLTYQGTYGRQNMKRRASTRRDPEIRHLFAARAVLSGDARGVSRGSVRFFDPHAMQRMHARYRAWIDGGRQGDAPIIVSCDALTLLEAWSFDYKKKPGHNRCPPDRTRSGRDTLAWVGPIAGVDPVRLFLMKPMPIGPRHTDHYQAARHALDVLTMA